VHSVYVVGKKVGVHNQNISHTKLDISNSQWKRRNSIPEEMPICTHSDQYNNPCMKPPKDWYNL